MIILYFFFFSSRRRHTRSLCDWSSDVCSSDLFMLGWLIEKGSVRFGSQACGVLGSFFRSEERRVGKGVDLSGRSINIKKKKKGKTVLVNVASELIDKLMIYEYE